MPDKASGGMAIMGGNQGLINARVAYDGMDEWYTTYEAVESELSHYGPQFAAKSVLCNCDDPLQSSFARYFLREFNRLGLARLVCTSYAGPRPPVRRYPCPNAAQQSLFSLPADDEARGLLLEVTQVPGVEGASASDTTIREFLTRPGVVRELAGDGDFRSPECVELLEECDICCTNPPFSLFSSLFSLLEANGKQYLLLANQNALTYKEVFPRIKEGRAWIGHHFGRMSFRVPDEARPRSWRSWQDASGQQWRSLGNVMWLTNLGAPRRQDPLVLTRSYDPALYPTYDGDEAIHVARVADIPADYAGIMGVPITFLKHYSEEQFEIVGEANHGTDGEFDLFRPTIQGRAVFKRLLIRNRKPSPPARPAAVQRSFLGPDEDLEAFVGYPGLRHSRPLSVALGWAPVQEEVVRPGQDLEQAASFSSLHSHYHDRLAMMRKRAARRRELPETASGD